MKFTLDLRRKNTTSDQFQAHSWSASTGSVTFITCMMIPLNAPVDGPTQWMSCCLSLRKESGLRIWLH
ncbi:hypothetical protein P8452_76403 [Trifolium repens]|nr:hypothetical protein P8452_76403 [Trifolium repens]